MAHKPKTLKMRWCKAREHGYSRKWNAQGDVIYEWGDGCAKADGGLLHTVLACERPRAGLPLQWDKSLLDELQSRGYDLTTLKLSIRKTEPPKP
jgi:hypothetical protein